MNDGLADMYRLHRVGLYRYAVSITRDRQDAEDVVHDAFARMCGQTGAGATGVAYVFRAVRNAAIDRLRKRRDVNEGLSIQSCLATDALAMDRERDRSIAAAVDTLVDDLREVVFLRVFVGLTYREIGELTGTPTQTVVSRYETGLRKLEPLLKKWL